MSQELASRFLITLLLCGAAYSARAAPDADPVSAYDLDEIVVTASRRGAKALDEPYSITVQDAEELTEIRQIRTIPEAMREQAGVMVQKTGHGQGSPYIRGFTGLRTLFLIDGVRLNNSTFRDGPNQYWNTVDAMSVDRLEVVKGPASVLYGSDAIGGTVNAISRGFESLDGNATRGRLVLRASSAEDAMSIRPEFGFSSGKLAVFAAMSVKEFGNLRAGGETGTQAKTGYQDRNADIKLSYALSADRHVTAALQSTNQDDAWRVHKTIYGNSWQGTTVGNDLRHSFDQQRVLAYLQYRASRLPMLRGGDMTLSLSHHQQDEQRQRVRESGDFDHQGTAVDTIGLFGHFDIPSAEGSWATGFEIYHDSVDSYRNDFDSNGNLERSRIQGPVADDASYVSADIYLQNSRRLGESSELISGVRYTKSRAAADSVENPTTGEPMSINESWRKLTGNLRFSHQVGDSEGRRVFAGISQGFRSPNLSDLTRFDSARTDEIETPVSGLKPEKFVSFEIGVKYEGGGWTGQFALYRTAIADMIIRTPTGRIVDGSFEVTKQNSGDGYVNGAELQLRYQLNDSLQVFGNVSWLEGEVDTFPDSSQGAVREPLDRQMPTQLFLGGRWLSPATGFWAEVMFGIADRQDQLSTRDRSDTDRIPIRGTPGYSYVTLRGGWRLQNNWRITAAAENVFDKNYRIHGSGLNEPGRNVVLSAIYTYK